MSGQCEIWPIALDNEWEFGKRGDVLLESQVCVRKLVLGVGSYQQLRHGRIGFIVNVLAQFNIARKLAIAGLY